MNPLSRPRLPFPGTVKRQMERRHLAVVVIVAISLFIVGIAVTSQDKPTLKSEPAARIMVDPPRIGHR